MSLVHHHEPIPKAAIVAACSFVLMTLAGVSIARLAGMPPEASPAAIRAQGQVAAIIAPGSNSGFIRGVMRGMARERMKANVGHDAPFRVTLWANGQLTLVDPATGRDVELSGFGDTNRAAFMALLKDAR
jgi:hypothetical protein